MSTRSRLLELDKVTPGMTLSEPLLDAKGEILLPEGATLTETMLVSLSRRGIEYLTVACSGEEEAGDGPDAQAQIELIRQRTDKLFRRCGQDGASGQLLKCIIRYRVG